MRRDLEGVEKGQKCRGWHLHVREPQGHERVEWRHAAYGDKALPTPVQRNSLREAYTRSRALALPLFDLSGAPWGQAVESSEDFSFRVVWRLIPRKARCL